MKKHILAMTSLTLLSACSIKPEVVNHYQLTALSAPKSTPSPTHKSLLVSPPDAVEGYQTNQMLYTQQPFKLNHFTKNNWFSPPAGMIYPLLIQSLQKSGYFYAVGSGPYVSKTDYRLDTQLLDLQQRFTSKPSVFDLKIKAVLTRTADNHLMASRTFSYHIPCSQDTPYGGVVAANRATRLMTKEITQFVIAHSDP